MTKLMEWLLVATILFALWLSLLTNTIESDFINDHYSLVLVSPIVVLGLFGLYAAAVVLYRVFTFNDCNEAAEELKKEIQEAKTELASKGFKFKKVEQ